MLPIKELISNDQERGFRTYYYLDDPRPWLLFQDKDNAWKFANFMMEKLGIKSVSVHQELTTSPELREKDLVHAAQIFLEWKSMDMMEKEYVLEQWKARVSCDYEPEEL